MNFKKIKFNLREEIFSMFKESLRKMKSAFVGSLVALASISVPLSTAVSNTSMLTASAVNDNYAKLLQYSLYFYDANMCGSNVNSDSQFSWRSNCHTGDEVKGGFHDAGDHAMFGLPQGYSASTLGWSYYEFKDAYNALGQTSHFKKISEHFCEFFKNSTKLDGSGNVSSFCYQKGDGDVDHQYWGKPENQESTQGVRKMFWTSSGASDIAAEYAAALAINYLNFGNAEDLKYAEALYKFSTQYNQVATDGPAGFYASNECRDEQAWAAGWLYKATNNEQYKNDCASKQVQYLGWVHSWKNVDLGAACVYAEITGDWSKVNDWIGQYTNSDSYFFLDKWGSARINTSMQMTALVASKHSNADYSSWCRGQMDYILGNNPANTCFVVGYAGNSAKNPHHRAASGYDSYDEFKGINTVGANSKTLVGALVGGPTDQNGTYVDSINDYVCNEVAIDYNAGLVGAAAGLYEVYKSGSVDSSIDGVGAVTIDPIVTTTTTTTSRINTTTTTTTTAVSTGSGKYTIKPNKTIVYDQLPEKDKMIGWDWSDFGIPSNEKVSKVEVKISASKNIGKWQGAFGTSTKIAPGYWTQSAEMEQNISGNSGSITWNVDSSTADIIQYNYGGQLKFGIWWIDCGTFTIDEVNVYTGSGSQVTTATTKPAVTTTTTAKPASSNGTHEIKPNKTIVYDQLPEKDKMIGWDWSDFGIPSNEKVSKVEVKISASKNIGKWQGAFGTSTKIAPGYWTQSAEMEQNISGNSGSITWNVDSSTADIIQYNYGGQLKFGIWWIDCGTFTIDSIKVYTTGGTTTTTTTTTTKTTTTTTTTKINASSGLKGDANGDGRVDIADVVAVAAYVANSSKNPLSSQQIQNADVHNTGDGITANDALKIQQYLANMTNL